MDIDKSCNEILFELKSSEELQLYCASKGDPDLKKIAERVLNAKLDTQRLSLEKLFLDKSLADTLKLKLQLIGDDKIKFVGPLKYLLNLQNSLNLNGLKNFNPGNIRKEILDQSLTGKIFSNT